MIIKITTDTKLFEMFYFKNALYMYFNNSATARQVHVSEGRRICAVIGNLNKL